MATQEDIRLAKIILKKGWLSKEELEQALRQVDKIRQHDPKINLPDYLGLKEILEWEKIEWALDVISASGPGAAAPPQEAAATPRAPAPRRARTPAGHRAGAHARRGAPRHAGEDGEHRHFVRRKKSSAFLFPRSSFAPLAR